MGEPVLGATVIAPSAAAETPAADRVEIVRESATAVCRHHAAAPAFLSLDRMTAAGSSAQLKEPAVITLIR